jgi:cellulose biosynthesis protein BcsQ
MGNREGMGLVLKRALLRVQDQFDYVLIDCPPVLGVMMVNALAACDRILVPVQTEFLALKGLERMMKTFEIMQRSKREKFRYTVIPTMFDKRTRASLMTCSPSRSSMGRRCGMRSFPSTPNSGMPVWCTFLPPSMHRAAVAPMPMRPCSTISTRWSVNGQEVMP